MTDQNDHFPQENTEETQPGPKEAEGECHKELMDEINALKDQLLRAMAETENVRARAQRELSDMAKFAKTEFAKDLLGVGDNLQRALACVQGQSFENHPLLKGLVDGITMTEKELFKAFEKHGIEKIKSLDEKFDHNVHQAMLEVENSDKPSGTIMQVMQEGYVLNGRLLRPAMVSVAK
jgi:molecular chaperone GrpE